MREGNRTTKEKTVILEKAGREPIANDIVILNFPVSAVDSELRAVSRTACGQDEQDRQDKSVKGNTDRRNRIRAQLHFKRHADRMNKIYRIRAQLPHPVHPANPVNCFQTTFGQDEQDIQDESVVTPSCTSC